MILRKPYAFFIKHFKLFHIIIAGLIIYAIFRMTGVIGFVNNYLESNSVLITEEDFGGVYGIRDFIIPIIILLSNILLLAIMTIKRKPNKFYMISTVMSAILLIINIYGYSTLKKLITIWLEATQLSVLSDMYIFVMIACIIVCAVFISRALGFNIGRFDFNNDILKFDLSEEDSAEFELMFDFDVNDAKRNVHKQARYFKYFIKENKSTLLTTFCVVVGFVLIYFGFSFLKYKKDVTKTNSLYLNGFGFTVNNSYIINSDYNGKKLEDDAYLLVVDASITNVGYSGEEDFITGTVNINIGDNDYYSTIKYNDDVTDLGIVYLDEKIKFEKTLRRLLIFKIPRSNLGSKTLLGIRNLDSSTNKYIKLKPVDLTKNENKKVEAKLGEKINLNDSSIENIDIKINNFELNNYFKVNYKYCATKTKCYNLSEYLVPNNAASNYDKTLLKIEGNFNINNDLIITNFYELFHYFGYIEYTINGKTYVQNNLFKEVKSKKVKQNDVYYIEVLADIKKADSVYLGLKIRNMDYRYELVKGKK